MNLSDVYVEIETRLRTIPKLNVPTIEAQSITADAVLWSLPEERNYDQTYGNGGLEQVPIELTLCIGKTSMRGATQRALEYSDPSGPRSVRQAINSTPATPYTSCDDVQVTQSKFAPVEVGGVEYLAVLFTVMISGSGR